MSEKTDNKVWKVRGWDRMKTQEKERRCVCVMAMEKKWEWRMNIWRIELGFLKF